MSGLRLRLRLRLLSSGPISYPLLPRGSLTQSFQQAALPLATLAWCQPKQVAYTQVWRCLSPAHKGQQPVVACELLPFSQTICLLEFLLRASLTQVCLLGLQAILCRRAYFQPPATSNITFLASFSEVPLSNICYLLRWSLHVTFPSFLSPTQPSSERTLTTSSDHQKGLPGPCAGDTPTLGQPPPPADYLAPAMLSLWPSSVPRKVLAAAAQPLPCPRPTSVLT